MKCFESTYKVGLIATVDDEESPHITMLSSLQASSSRQLILGQFTEGLSKDFMKIRPQVGFLIMGMDRRFWTGTARWTHCRTDGEEYDMYNKKPLFRYNTYFGIHTVHYFDLIEISEGENLKMGSVVFRAALNAVGKQFYKGRGGVRVLKPWAENLMKGLQTLKFFSWVSGDGIPRILPVIEAQASDSKTLVIPAKPYAEKAADLEKGAAVAINGLNFDMVGTLVKGRFGGFTSSPFGKAGRMDVKRVYNSLPPKAGYVYP